ncbi:hypothetical protein VFPPC_17090 [Pochonia chlamydosporia 170]|uniref:Uncharacterized protein n=1 Tax=Pochonia chlamydosporia 170 TaxID=1380566 RepID=A0A179EXP1_METCM|nr:hypothetical protein VFPPC_17090 [Pochonia chlamydosporia 170]OAQ57780.1 hypothetical protein VFPPC_17090 [Pochonia chlamydosporia 170]
MLYPALRIPTPQGFGLLPFSIFTSASYDTTGDAEEQTSWYLHAENVFTASKSGPVMVCNIIVVLTEGSSDAKVDCDERKKAMSQATIMTLSSQPVLRTIPYRQTVRDPDKAGCQRERPSGDGENSRPTVRDIAVHARGGSFDGDNDSISQCSGKKLSAAEPVFRGG